MGAPDVRRYVGVCMACENWQVDVRAGAVSDLGGSREAFVTVAEVSAEHIHNDCVGGPEGDTVLFNGQRVQRPRMENGEPSTGSLAMHPLPEWWVAR